MQKFTKPENLTEVVHIDEWVVASPFHIYGLQTQICNYKPATIKPIYKLI